MALASSPSVFTLRLPYQKCRSRPSLQVRAQRYEDEGTSRHDIVDANLRILMNRIQEVKMKERLERYYQNDQLGWNYARYHNTSKRSPKPFPYIELVGTVGGTFGLTILSGILGLCLASILLHLSQL